MHSIYNENNYVLSSLVSFLLMALHVAGFFNPFEDTACFNSGICVGGVCVRLPGWMGKIAPRTGRKAIQMRLRAECSSSRLEREAQRQAHRLGPADSGTKEASFGRRLVAITDEASWKQLRIVCVVCVLQQGCTHERFEVVVSGASKEGDSCNAENTSRLPSAPNSTTHPDCAVGKEGSRTSGGPHRNLHVRLERNIQRDVVRREE